MGPDVVNTPVICSNQIRIAGRLTAAPLTAWCSYRLTADQLARLAGTEG